MSGNLYYYDMRNNIMVMRRLNKKDEKIENISSVEGGRSEGISSMTGGSYQTAQKRRIRKILKI